MFVLSGSDALARNVISAGPPNTALFVGAVNVTAGGRLLAINTVTTLEVAAIPSTSVPTAVNPNTPAGTLLQIIENGEFVSSPILSPLTKNSTFATLSSTSVAETAI